VGLHVYPRTVVSVSKHYGNPTQCVGLEQNGPNHHLIENEIRHFKDTKGVIRSNKSKKDIQCNDQKKQQKQWYTKHYNGQKKKNQQLSSNHFNGKQKKD
jgi:hypothetical protein